MSLNNNYCLTNGSRTVRKLIFALGLLCPKVLADQSFDDLLSLTLDELLRVKVTSVSNLPESLTQVPSTIYIFERREFLAMGITTLAELLKYSPSIEYGDPHSWLQGGIRGFSDNWSKVKLLIDGEETNLLYTGEAFIGHQYSLHNIQRVEVIPGPSSVIYGVDAYTGVINLVTRQDFNKNLNIHHQHGDKDFQGLSSSFYASDKTQSLQWQIAGHYQHLEDADFSKFVRTDEFSEANITLRSNLLDSGNYPYQDLNYAYSLDLKLDYRPTSQQQWNINYSKTFDRDGGGLESPEISFTNFYTKRDQQKLNFSYKLDPKQSAWQTKVAFSYRQEDEFNQFNAREPFDGELSPLFNADIASNKEYRLDWLTRYRLPSQSANLMMGIGTNRKELVAPNFELNDFDELTPFLIQNEQYIFLQSQSNVLDSKDRLTLGARYNRSDIYDSPIVYRLGYSRNFTQGLTVKFLYGESFRAPTLFELGINENLVPSEMRTYEISTIYTRSKNWLLQLAAFQNQANKLVINRQTTANDNTIGIFSAFNEGNSKVNGIELKTKYYFGNALLTAWFSYTNLNQQKNIARNKFGFLYSQSICDWKLGLAFKYTSKVTTVFIDQATNEQNLLVPNYMTVDANVSYLFSESNTRLWLKISNLLDRENYFANVRGNDPKQFMDYGRQLELGIALTFE